jgi:nucleotide-binding universal stress UspA family protein
MIDSAPQISTIGVMLAVLFVGSMGGILWWMLHPPAPIGAAVARAFRGVSALKRILIPVKGTTYSDRAVELACRLGLEQQAELILAYVIEVPLSLPLSTPLDQEQKKAEEVVERAAELVKLHGMKAVSIIKRDREVQRGVLSVVNDRDVDLVVIGLNPRRVAAGDSVGRGIEAILRRAGIEVIIDMVPEH